MRKSTLTLSGLVVVGEVAASAIRSDGCGVECPLCLT